jgi:hypothetical protein
MDQKYYAFEIIRRGRAEINDSTDAVDDNQKELISGAEIFDPPVMICCAA